MKWHPDLAAAVKVECSMFKIGTLRADLRSWLKFHMEVVLFMKVIIENLVAGFFILRLQALIHEERCQRTDI